MKSVAFKGLLAALFLSALALLAAGCSSYSTSVNSGVSLSKYQRVWVKSNFDDNHGIAQFIRNALRARGITADAGPLTMMPFNMQAVITYRDTWAWDFKDHMTGLVLSLQDTKINYPIATAEYNGPASLSSEPSDVAAKLVAKLFGPASGKKNR